MRLKRWVKIVLEVIILISMIFMASDCEDLTQFVVSHAIAALIFAGCMLLLIKFE